MGIKHYFGAFLGRVQEVRQLDRIFSALRRVLIKLKPMMNYFLHRLWWFVGCISELVQYLWQKVVGRSILTRVALHIRFVEAISDFIPLAQKVHGIQEAYTTLKLFWRAYETPQGPLRLKQGSEAAS